MLDVRCEARDKEEAHELRDGHGEAEPGSLAYYGGGQWHKFRERAQNTLEPYIFD